MKTIILRHRRENLKKCSLTGLESHPELLFITYPIQSLPPLEGYLLLAVGAPPLCRQDADRGLLLIDATWRLAAIMSRTVPPLEARSLPDGLRTAYPRRQTECPDPLRGLASVEALFAAHLILGKSTETLLDFYRWKESFLSSNRSHLPFS